MHAQIIELFGNTKLVFNRRRDALDLQTVAQCGVEYFDHVFRHFVLHVAHGFSLCG